MKIAILTLPLHTNYGGILQAYALQTVLERMGHQVEVLQKKPGHSHPLWLMPLVYGKRLTKKILKDRHIPIFAEQKEQEKDKIYSQYTKRFIKQYIHSRSLNSIREILPRDYDAIIVGSDQVWRRDYNDKKYSDIMLVNNPYDAFLSFTRDWEILRIAYAASFGFDTWDYSETETLRCQDLIAKFDGVSVREKSGTALCSKYLKTNAIHVLDPTMLLNKSDYQELFSPDKGKKYDQSVVCHILDMNPDKERIIQNVSQSYGVKPVYTNVDSASYGLSSQPPIESWLQSIIDSEIVVTDSFHACVFSIIFNKPFIAIGNKDRGLTRFISLLDVFELKHLLIDEKEMALPDLSLIDYKKVDIRLQEMRSLSFDFIKTVLTHKNVSSL